MDEKTKEKIMQTVKEECGAILVTLHYFAQRSPGSVVEYKTAPDKYGNRVHYGIFVLKPPKSDPQFLGKILRWKNQIQKVIEKFVPVE